MATIATTIPRTTFDQSIRLRGESRSERAPPTSMKIARGTAATISTVPSATPELVSCRVSQASAMKWNWSPIREIVSPVKISRKSRTRNGCRREGVAARWRRRPPARSLRSLCYSVLIWMPSPFSSSESTMVPMVSLSTACSMSAA